jgi:hypothetical protein
MNIIAKRVVTVDEVVAILEDNMPNCALEQDLAKSTIRIRKTSHIGASVSLSVYRLFFSQENVQKLRQSGVPESFLQGLGQGTVVTPMDGNELRAHVERTLKKKEVKGFWQEHKTKIFGICGYNSLITISEWDPNELGGLLTGGNAFYISHRQTFEKELLNLLSSKFEHSAASVPSSSNCFIATAASGNADDPSVVALRTFRDQRLTQTLTGRAFIRMYATYGPIIANIIRPSKLARKITFTFCVRPCAYLVSDMVDATNKKNESQK